MAGQRTINFAVFSLSLLGEGQGEGAKLSARLFDRLLCLPEDNMKLRDARAQALTPTLSQREREKDRF
jgi:hypothetical protein